jgi:hypothetical protein
MDRRFTWPATMRDPYPAHPNPYGNPGACGLELLAELRDPEASYSFSTILAWRDLETGDVYVGHDSGCSCPVPFEDFRGLSDMTLITDRIDLERFVREIEQRHYVRYRVGDALDFFRKVEEKSCL